MSAASLRATDPLLGLIAEAFDASIASASAAVTAFALSYGLLQVVCGPLGDRYGRYATVAGACLISAVGTAACAAAPDLEALVLARFVSGASIGALIPLSIAWIGDTFAYERRQAVLARFLIGQMLGLAFGTALAGWLGEQLGWRAIFVALAVALVVIGVLLGLELRRNPLTRPAPGKPSSFARSFAAMAGLFASPWVRTILAICFAEGVLIAGPFAFIALQLQQRYAIGPGLAGTLIAAYAAGGLAYAASARRAVAGIGEVGLVGFGGGALVLGYGALALAPSLFLATAALVVLGVGFYALHTTVQTHATQMAPGARGGALALFAGFLFLGQAAGVWMAGRLADAAGLPAMFAVAAGAVLALTLLLRRALVRHRA